jgi:hypothetical protein
LRHLGRRRERDVLRHLQVLADFRQNLGRKAPQRLVLAAADLVHKQGYRFLMVKQGWLNLIILIHKLLSIALCTKTDTRIELTIKAGT